MLLDKEQAATAAAWRDNCGQNRQFLELFYDLAYVAVIAQAAHHLAEHVSFRGFPEFALVFSLIWIAWVNGPSTSRFMAARTGGLASSS
ncbi:MAG TPA: low temperature requirement protein A [Jiangellaceae bacterium]|nr:low temperature requirement protein A [Jiangellaceae bacterium]